MEPETPPPLPIPDAEKLTRRERLGLLGRQLLDALARNTEAYTGTPSARQTIIIGIEKAEDHANQHRPDPQDPEPHPDQ
jgi:hypothetical protein